MAIRSKTQRSLLMAFVLSISCCGIVGIYCIAVGQVGRLMEQILLTTATVGACSILSLASAVPWEQRRWHPIGPVGVFAVAATCVLSLWVIWSIDLMGYPASLDEEVGTAWVIAVALPHIGLLSQARLKTGWTIVQTATVVLAVLLASLVICGIYGWIRGSEIERLLGIVGIATACGTIVVPILHRVSAIRVREAVRTVELAVSLTCPRCGRQQELGVGRSKCVQCSLKFLIEIEEDNCPKCGYPLYQLKSAVCPECGTPVLQNQA